MNDNLILNVDSYKTSHFLQYPPGTEQVSSYIESRGGAYPEVVFFGLQMFLKRYLTRPISARDIDEAEEVLAAHGMPFNRAGWQHVLEAHGGYLPLEIEAVPEGSCVPSSNVLLQVRNTDPRCAWLTSYLETALLRALWYPATVATRSLACRRRIQAALERTADTTEDLEFKLHDFGARGVSSNESAAIGSAAHLLSFSGTDTLAGVLALRRYYHAPMAGFSIPAAEHSTITCWGREREGDAYRNMLDTFAGSGKTVAVVSDSYDLFAAIDRLWGGELKPAVSANGGTLVIRPDSGDPVDIVWRTVEALMARFGSRVNGRGYRQLPDYLRVIQGDGVSPETIGRILDGLEERGISAANVAFGMGGELLQRVDRDTLKFAMKASAIRIDGVWRDVCKDPATDPGKRSKAGRLRLVRRDGTFVTERRRGAASGTLAMEPVFRNGELLRDEAFETIRRRLHSATAPAQGVSACG